ncbi:hypothetical protein DRW48_02215 [Paracoccus suum]|uniref:DUF4164 family protein n=1 Tax=Paracoccus suum TaxID=2259340 RepID=A0A344PH06_9RHOB|nr:hypothetical protein [Paracoccus suum]AXC48661.1 hypothetical protein DRW48_02215 [Paracoccus suum]
MSDIAASEQRLIAALDRIDRSIDAGTARRADLTAAVPAPPDDGALAAAQAAMARLTAELADLRVQRAADVAQMEAMLTTIEGLLADDAGARDDDLPAPAASLSDDPSGAALDSVFSEAEGR